MNNQTDYDDIEHLNFLVRLNHPDVLDAMIRLKDMRSKMKRADNTYEMQFSDRVEYSKYVDVVRRYRGTLNEPFHTYFKVESEKTNPWFEGLIAIHSPIDSIREAAEVIVKDFQ